MQPFLRPTNSQLSQPNFSQSIGIENFLRQKKFWLIFSVSLIGLLISKGGILLPGMAADDYAFAFKGDAAGNLENFVSQGRILSSLLTQAVDATGLPLTGIYIFTSALSFCAISLAIAAAIALIQPSGRSKLIPLAAAIFAATHPYLTSYFLFRMSTLSHAVTYFLLFASLLILQHRGTIWQKYLFTIAILVVCSHTNQSILILYAITAGAWAVSRMCEMRAQGAQWHDSLSGVTFVATALSVATVFYLLSSTAIRAALGVEASDTYTPNIQGSIWNTLGSAANLAYGIIFRDEPILSLWIKIWLAVTIASAIILCTLREWVRGLAVIAFLSAGLLASVSPLALSWGGHVPRTFSPAGLCFALALCMACAPLSPTRIRLTAAALLPVIGAFCAIGSTLFYQQSMLTQWDQRTAAHIYSRAVEIVDAPRLRIAFQWPAHSKLLSMNGEGINESAFMYPWSLPGLFAVATGELVDVGAADKSLCRNRSRWPAQSSIAPQSDGTILVCMVN